MYSLYGRLHVMYEYSIRSTRSSPNCRANLCLLARHISKIRVPASWLDEVLLPYYQDQVKFRLSYRVPLYCLLPMSLYPPLYEINCALNP